MTTQSKNNKWNAVKGETILISESSEKKAWAVLGAKDKGEREFLKTFGFNVVKS
jgi:hypothetical protein